MAQQRKLATIMSVDIAGYSRSAERDEAAAVDHVARLKQALAEAASAQGGRIFSTAGDGAMLEFPTASAGLVAAADLLKREGLPGIRIGVHLGEVTIDGDDLLGHGVNVAARLQALADSGTAMMSGAIHVQARETEDFAVVACGRVRLDKMSETIDVFALTPRGHTLRRLRLRRLRPYVLAAGVLLAAIIGGTIAFTSRPYVESMSIAGAVAPSVAVLPFASLNTDAEGQFFAESISLSVANALNATGVRVVSRSDEERPNARYLVNGDVRREDDVVRVMVRIDDTRAQETVLSEEFESPGAQASMLPSRIATRIASISWTLQVSAAGGGNAELTSSLIDVLGMQDRGDYMAAYVAARDLSRTYPNEPMAQFLHAINAGMAYWEIPEADFNDAMAAARASAERAHRLAPRFGEAYSADHNLLARHLWAEREAPLRRGLEVDPRAPHLSTWLSALLMRTGRARDAEPLMEAAVARDPYNPLKADRRIRLLAILGDEAGAEAEIARAERLWPGAVWISSVRLSVTTPVDAQVILRDPAIRNSIAPPASPAHVVVRALVSRRPGDVAAARRACRDVGRGTVAEMCFVGLARLGELDDAFTLGERLFPDQRGTVGADEAQLRLTRRFHSPDTLFVTGLAPLRADPRFVDLAARLNLLAYWRIEGNEPDFCAVEDAPVCDVI